MDLRQELDETLLTSMFCLVVETGILNRLVETTEGSHVPQSTSDVGPNGLNR